MPDRLACPSWLKKRVSISENIIRTRRVVRDKKLNTVCESAMCPNLNECYSRSVATFMILGSNCTRSCRFCSVSTGEPERVDLTEPGRIAEATGELGIRHLVVTSVTRDDLVDCGANQFARTVIAVKNIDEAPSVEVLVPDMLGKRELVKIVVDSKPEIFGHNIETVEGLYMAVRKDASYIRSLDTLRLAKEANPHILTKSGIMLGMGETEREVARLMKDLRSVGCEVLTIGQYLPPHSYSYPVYEYVHPDRFKGYESLGLSMGFKDVYSGPFVRSSYMADERYNITKEVSYEGRYSSTAC